MDEVSESRILKPTRIFEEDFFRNGVANGDKRQQKAENLDRLDALYRHWEGLSLSLEKQAEDFEKRLQEERDRTDAQMRQLRKCYVPNSLLLKFLSEINSFENFFSLQIIVFQSIFFLLFFCFFFFFIYLILFEARLRYYLLVVTASLQ